MLQRTVSMHLCVSVQKQDSPTLYPRILYPDTFQILANSHIFCETRDILNHILKNRETGVEILETVQQG